MTLDFMLNFCIYRFLYSNIYKNIYYIYIFCLNKILILSYIYKICIYYGSKFCLVYIISNMDKLEPKKLKSYVSNGKRKIWKKGKNYYLLPVFFKRRTATATSCLRFVIQMSAHSKFLPLSKGD